MNKQLKGNNMLNKLKQTTLLWTLILAPISHAVNLSNNGLGEVLIYPYYTVNNDFNTLYTVINTTADTKAIRIRFLEGHNGAEALDFNVYLDAYDVFTGALIPTLSTISGHIGQNSTQHLTQDASCTPFLIKSGQEFLPFEIDAQDPQNNDMDRVREGHIEIYEMTTFDGSTVAFADHGTSGVPGSCGSIEGDWSDNGLYDILSDESLVTGGLMGSADIIDVANGKQFSYRAVAIDNFWVAGMGNHTIPGSTVPNLNFSDLHTEMVIDGVVETTMWSSGIEAISALLMKHDILNNYSIDPINDSKTEWVVSFPTKSLHVNEVGPEGATQPFSSPWDGDNSCHNFRYAVWDSETQNENINMGIALCRQTNVIEFLPPDQPVLARSGLLGSSNHVVIESIDSPSATPSGWAKVVFDDALHQMSPWSGVGLSGLPAVGFQVQQIANNNAQPGLLAHYVKHSQLKGTVKPIQINEPTQQGR